MPYQQVVEAHHKLMFSDNVKMVAQQLQNPLRAAVTIVPASGEAMSVADLIGKKEYRRAADRDRRNPDDPSPRSRRWLVRPDPIETGEYIDKAEKFDGAMDPTSPLLKNNVAAAERGVFDSILGIRPREDGSFVLGEGGILGVAREGKRGTTVVPFPAPQTIAHGSTGLTLAKLREVRLRLTGSDFGMETEDQLWGLITPKQVDDLLGIATQTGAALNAYDVQQIREGKPTRLLGFDWIPTNRAPRNATGQRICPFWSKQNVVMGVWQDVQGIIFNDTSAKNLPVIFVDAYVDATRVEDAGVFAVECAE